MRQCLSLGLLAWTPTVLSSPLAVSNPLSLNSATINTTDSLAHNIANLSQIPIPPGFKISVESVESSTLSAEAFYYSNIVALAKIACSEFDGVIPHRVFRNDRFPLHITFDTLSPSSPMPTKYAVWGLVLATLAMKDVIGFKEAFYSLQWQGSQVGSITIRDPGGVSRFLKGRIGKSEEVANNRVISGLPTEFCKYGTASLEKLAEGTNLTAPLNARGLTIYFRSRGRQLDKDTVFMTIISALSEAVLKDTYARVTDVFNSYFDGFHARFTTDEVSPAPTVPPYYTFELLIASLKYASEYLVEYKAWRELEMTLLVNGNLVGESVLRYMRYPPLTTALGNLTRAGVSTA